MQSFFKAESIKQKYFVMSFTYGSGYKGGPVMLPSFAIIW